MANTVHGPFVKGAATATGSYGTGVGQSNTYTSGNANNDETQSGVALASFNPDLVGAGFILSGVSCVKDGTTASQLNITSGAAYLVMTDGTTARIDVASTTESTTGHPSATLYLDLNPDGSWSWGTSHSAQANYLPIAQVTTDASANIATVTDKRVMLPQALPGTAHPAAAQPGGALLPSPLVGAFTQSASAAARVVGGVSFGQMGALAGSMDGAASFNGSTGYLDVPTTGLPTGNAAFSLEGWFKTSASGVFQMIWNMGPNTAKEAAMLYINGSNQLVGDLNSSSVHSAATVTNGAWHHAVFTWDGTNGTLYLDGAQVATSAALGPNNLTQSIDASVGQQLPISSNFFNGTLDEAAIYGAALSGARVTAHYNAGISTTSDGYAAAVLADAPLRYYRLGDANGASLAICHQATVSVPIVNADGTFQIGGVGGQASVGRFGVPVIVAQAVRVNVTVTTQVTILSYTAPASGIYEATLYFEVNNGTSGQIITVQLFGTDPDTNGTSGSFFTTNAGGPTVLGNSNNLVNGSYPCYVIPIAAKASTTINVTYQDHGGTPSDFVSAFIKRLS